MKTQITTTIAVILLATSSFAQSAAIKPEFVDMLLKPYFELQDALASDDLARSQEHAKSFDAMLGHGPSVNDAPSLAELGDASQKIVAATSIADARAAFLSLSSTLTKLVEEVGTTSQSDIMLMHCPMAFGGKGGDWLQNHSEIANPYFGSMMYRCGSMKKKLVSVPGKH